MAMKSVTGRAGFEVGYDEDADVLYVAIEKPREADSFDAGHGLLVRKDPTTNEIVGVTILHYGHLFKKLEDLTWLNQLGLPGPLKEYLMSRP
jgi:uncharacterized protein YuzE